MATKTKTKGTAVPAVVIPPEFSKRLRAEAAAYRGMEERYTTGVEKRTPIVAALTHEAFQLGLIHTGRGTMAQGAEKQGDYAKRFGVKSGAVTKWRRIGAALALGVEAGSPLYTRLTKVTNDKEVGPLLDSGEATLQSVTRAVNQRFDENGAIKPRPGTANKSASEEDSNGVRLSAANVVDIVSAIGAGIVRDWDSWNLSAETSGALLEALEGITTFVGEQTPKKRRAPRAKSAKSA